MRKIIKDFSKYSIIGIIISILNIVLTWFLIDIIRIETFLATTLVVIAMHILKYFSYRTSKLFDSKTIGSRQFIIYSVIVVFSSILHILLIWFMVDGLHLSTIISVTTVVVGLFIMRFILFRSTRLIEKDTQ
jgi:uncharacterized membrane protein YwzB